MIKRKNERTGPTETPQTEDTLSPLSELEFANVIQILK